MLRFLSSSCRQFSLCAVSPVPARFPALARLQHSAVGPEEACNTPHGPLQGIKVRHYWRPSWCAQSRASWVAAWRMQVLDLGQVVAGNFCGAALAYFGADVIKVEPPGAGDALRSLRTADTSGTSLWWRSYVSAYLWKQLFKLHA